MPKKVARPVWQRVLLGAGQFLPTQPIYGNCLALYAGRDAHLEPKRCFEVIQRQLELFGKQADMIGLGANEGVTMVAPRAALSHLEKEGWSSPSAFNMDIKASRPVGGFITGYYVSSGFSKENGYLYFCYGNDLGSFDEGYFRELASEFSGGFNFEYGIAYQRRFRLGPDVYALGMIAGLNHSIRERAERKTIAKWLNANGYFERRGDSRSRHLRDVYEINFLSRVHLEREVEGKRLRDWILDSPCRGRLEPFAGDRWIWAIAKKNIEDTRAVLKARSLLIAYRPDIPPMG